MSVRRIFVEKKPDYAVKAGELREELVSYLGYYRSEECTGTDPL